MGMEGLHGEVSAKTGFEFGDVEVEFGTRGWKENTEREASDTTQHWWVSRSVGSWGRTEVGIKDKLFGFGFGIGFQRVVLEGHLE